MSRRKKVNNARALVAGLIVTLAALGAGLWAVDDLNAADLATRLAGPVVRLMAFIGLGLVAAQAIEAAGWTKKLGCIAGPLFRYANLGVYCSAVFTAAFFPGVAANAMLLDFFKEAKITRQQVFLTNFMNQLPAYFLHLPMIFFIVAPLIRSAGLLYFGLTFLAALLRTVAFALFGYFFIPPQPAGSGRGHFVEISRKRIQQRRKQPFWPSVREKLPSRFFRILAFVVPAYAVAHVLAAAGAFDWLQIVMARFAVQAIVPVESLSVVALSFASEFTAGFAAAGALMDAEGAISDNGRVIGTYIHGFFDTPAILKKWLHHLGLDHLAVPAESGIQARDRQYDLLTHHVEAHVDVDEMLNILQVEN